MYVKLMTKHYCYYEVDVLSVKKYVWKDFSSYNYVDLAMDWA